MPINFFHRKRRLSSHGNDRRGGYGLVVIAALFTAFAVVAAAALERNTAMGEIERQATAKEQLQRLSKALLRYARDNGNRFPCPMDSTLAYTNASYGMPVNANSCVAGGPWSGTSFFGAGNIGIVGTVPVRALIPYGVSISDSIDPWGGRIALYVHRQMTPGGSGAPATRLTVTDTTTGLSYADADYVLVSFGRDHMGAYMRDTGSIATSCQTAWRAGENCDTDSIFFVGPEITYSAANRTTQTFDDIISWGRI